MNDDVFQLENDLVDLRDEDIMVSPDGRKFVFARNRHSFGQVALGAFLFLQVFGKRKYLSVNERVGERKTAKRRDTKRNYRNRKRNGKTMSCRVNHNPDKSKSERRYKKSGRELKQDGIFVHDKKAP